MVKPQPANVPVARLDGEALSKPSRREEPAFMPPEAVHDNDPTPDEKPNPNNSGSQAQEHSNFGKNTNADPKKKLSRTKNPIKWVKEKWLGLSKKGKIITVAVATLLIGGSASAAVIFWPEPPPPPKPAPIEKIVEPPKPTTEASNLTGLQVGFDINKLPVTAVMIENSPDARPQAGLVDAGVVVEAVAEGGITRFVAMYQDTKPAHVGPVRSARPYYVRWMLGFDANYAHAGGSPEAINLIQALGVKDIDHGANGSTYNRVSQRYAPHNLYTSIERLLAAGASRGFTSSTYTGFVRKPEKKVATPTASAIDIAISSTLYNVHYAYDTANNSYLRSEGGKAHTDEKSGKQINPKVVITLVTDKGFDPDGVHTTYRVTGSGSIIVFQDGETINGTWSKASDKAPLLFKDAAGQDLKLNPGQTWITAVGNASAVTFTP